MGELLHFLRRKAAFGTDHAKSPAGLPQRIRSQRHDRLVPALDKYVPMLTAKLLGQRDEFVHAAGHGPQLGQPRIAALLGSGGKLALP